MTGSCGVGRCDRQIAGIRRRLRTLASVVALIVLAFNSGQIAADEIDVRLSAEFTDDVRPLLQRLCFECHSEDRTEADIDLAAFATATDVRKRLKVWLKVGGMIETRQMPPKDSPQPTSAEVQLLRDWLREFLTREAETTAGDPGPVVLRRLNNEEYNYTVRDLTGVDSLNPTREFPVDGAAGEGFINTGAAQSMSPSFVTKYFNAAKEVASHAMLLPDGIGFSPHTTRRDQTDYLAANIQAFYRRFTSQGGAQSVTLHGLTFNVNEGGVLPVRPYLLATLEDRDALRNGQTTIEQVAKTRGLNAKYLAQVWTAMAAAPNQRSLLLDQLREQWWNSKPTDVGKLARMISDQQKVLFTYNPIGHIGTDGKPKIWMDSASPVASRRDVSVGLPGGEDGEVSIFLSVSDAGDGRAGDYVVWQNARLTSENGPDILLRDLVGLKRRVREAQRDLLLRTTDCLAAVAELKTNNLPVTEQLLEEVAEKHKLDAPTLEAWTTYLGIGRVEAVVVSGHFEKTETHGDYKFIRSWGTGKTPIVTANSSDTQVRIPGIARPHGITAHPSPTLFAAIGWQSPIDGVVEIEAQISDAHPECGDGQEWFLQHRTNRKVGNLWKGKFGKGGSARMEPKQTTVRKGELISFIVGPGPTYYCDLTEMNLTITEVNGEKRTWDLAKDVSGNILASNPHADGHGHRQTWHFYKGEMKAVHEVEDSMVSVPGGSVLSRWQVEKDRAKQIRLAQQVQALAVGDRPTDAKSPDGLLYEQLMNLTLAPQNLDSLLDGVEPDDRFGKHPLGHEMAPTDLVVHAPSVVEFKVPAKLATGRTLVAGGLLDPQDGRDGTVRIMAGLNRIESASIGTASPIIVNEGSRSHELVLTALQEFRDLFPSHLCYARIVPVDEVVTLTLYYRQDDALQRLMLNDAEIDELNQMWDELIYVAQEPLRYEVAFEQIREFATQDRPDLVKVWDPLKQGVVARADQFRKRLVNTEAVHLNAVADFAVRAWRRPLTSTETADLRSMYQQLREAEITHDQSIRLTLARVLASPAFLYRREVQPDGPNAQVVSGTELATRLSYFLWSSLPDAELLKTVGSDSLDNNATLRRQALRMLEDSRTRRLAIQFACQWMHLREFDQNDDKNEALYPEFAELRDDMYEETVRFFENMFRNDGSILDLLNADHTFLNESLAEHYGIEGVGGTQWRRVENVQSKGRGGILGMATLLASQSGASRTSPILRGNWIYETLLGERLPRPPTNVPQLPEAVPSGLTARQLIEKHSSVPECATCHAKIDPYGFALEQYDAIGRLREAKVDTTTRLVDGRTIDGMDGLRNYLLNERRDDVVRQFCRKLLGFALGREVQLSDDLLLVEMQRKLKANDYRFSVAVEAIVTSPQFRQIRGSGLSHRK